MKLLGQERVGDRLEKWWLHTGDDGKDRITVETVQDVEPAFKRARLLSETPSRDMKFQATIPGTVMEEICRINAQQWGCKTADVFREMIQGKTDRAKALWNLLLKSSDYKKFQAQ